MKKISLKPIAFAKSDFKEKVGTPRQSGLVKAAKAVLEFVPNQNWAQAIEGLEGFSHLWVIYLFDKQDNLEWNATIESPREGIAKKIGVLASRSPHRPNPIGLSAVKLEKVEQKKGAPVRLWVSGVDFLEGTPILDIKPYLSYCDEIQGTTSGWAKDPIARYEVELSENVEKKLAQKKEFKELLIETLSLDPRPVSQKKRWKVSDVKSELILFSFRLGTVDVKWKIKNQIFRVEDLLNDVI